MAKKTKKKARKAPRRRRRKPGSQWTKRQLNVLHECWKATSTRKACLELVVKKLPEMPPPAAWALVRKLSRTEQAWIMTARQKERDKEKKKRDKEKARAARAKKREERERTKERRDRRSDMRDLLRDDHADKVAEEIGTDFFFCPDIRQQVSVLTCIFRVFSPPGQYGFSHGGSCASCRRMDKHLPVLERVLSKETKDAKQRAGRHKAGTRRRKAEKPEAEAAQKAASRSAPKGREGCCATRGRASPTD